MTIFQTYKKDIQDLYSSNMDDVTELSFRTSLENLLKSFITEKKYKLTVIHEAKKQKSGRPDFKVKNKIGVNVGHVETKPIGTNLDKILDSKQLNKYRLMSENIIVTDYLRFILIKKGKPVDDIVLLRHDELAKGKSVTKEQYELLDSLFTIFFSGEPEPITNPQDLAIKLAVRAKYLKQYCLDEFQTETNTRLDALYDVFEKSLLPDLTQKDFADIYAQTVTYGLFLAFLNCDDPKLLDEKTAYDYLPQSFSLVKELFHQLEEFPQSVLWVIDEIISILKCVVLEALLQKMSYGKGEQKTFVDPYIYFYETFLTQYDKELKKIQGIFFTPTPIVSFIVSSISKLLGDEFDIHDGFINNRVTVLDFACGTGTFLVDVFRNAIQDAYKLGDNVTIQKEITGHTINHFYGFELMVVPYVIAHLKISQFLKENNCPIDADKRLNIFLTNTLNTAELKQFPLLPSLTSEGEKANRVKRQPILVILGNPPYNNKSTNINDWILNLIADYKPVDERKLNLDDDYIKFIRFAHWKMEKVEQGIIGIITNNSFLSGITHRKMRGMLRDDFSKIYILNLHGNHRIGETCPDGSRDDNVFDIQQGVAISIFVKDKQKQGKAKVYSCDLYGLKLSKYEVLRQNDVSIIKNELPIDEFNEKFKSTEWGRKRFIDDLNFFVLKDSQNILQYGNFWGLTEIFKHYNSGIETKRDKLTIHLTKEKLHQVIQDFKHLNNNEIRVKHNLPPDGRDWSIESAGKNLANTSYSEANFQQIHYRPFDVRWTYFTNKSKGFIAYPRYDTMANYVADKNYGFTFSRQVVCDTWQHIFVTSQMPERCLVSIKTRECTYTTPLYLYKNDGLQPHLPGHEEEWRSPNFQDGFTKFISSLYDFKPSPEEIMGYMYAVLNSPTYRTKYDDFLKMDFPRIPFTTNKDMFIELSKIGDELIAHHLLRKSYADNVCQFLGIGTNYKIEKVSYSNNKIYINKDRFFSPISKEIWDFHIGGYQVLYQWLKERHKNHMDIDVKQFIQIVNIISETIKIMARIDKITNQWI